MSGCQVVFNHLSVYAARLRPAVGAVVATTCRRIEARAKVSMTGGKHGRTYRRGAIKSRRKADRGQVIGYKFHRASAPGEAPAVDTGALMGSIQHEMTGPTEGIVFSNLVPAVILEFGGSRMAARPFMTPAANAERARHVAEIARVLAG